MVLVPREGLLEEDEASSLTAWAQGYRKFGRIYVIRSRDVATINPSQAAQQESCAQNYVRKGTTETRPKHPYTIPRQSERSQHRTYYWSRAEKTHPLLPLQTTWTYGERVSESSTEGYPSIFSQEFLLPRDAFAQLHNLSSYMLYDGASKTVVGCNSDLKIPEFIGLILGPARGLPDTGAQQPVVGASAALRWCDRLLKRHGLVPVDVTPSNMIATCGGIGTAKVVHVLDFTAGIVGCERSDAIPGARGAHVGRWKTTVHSTADTITIMRLQGANIRMKDGGDVLEIEEDQGTTHTEKLVR